MFCVLGEMMLDDMTPEGRSRTFQRLMGNGVYRLSFWLVIVGFSVVSLFLTVNWAMTVSPADEFPDIKPALRASAEYDLIMGRTDIASRASQYNDTLSRLRDRGAISAELADEAKKDRRVYDPDHDLWKSRRDTGSSASALYFNEGVTLR